MSKKFIEIITTYPAICTYPEYEGKPYFSIRYEENGEIFEGFGTYKPEVLSEYIRKYFMRHAEWLHEQLALPLSDGSKECVRCSSCLTHWDNESNYCPYCGADMRGEENDN